MASVTTGHVDDLNPTQGKHLQLRKLTRTLVHARLEPGALVKESVHGHKHEVLYVLSGGIVFTTADGEELVTVGSYFDIPSGTLHGYHVAEGHTGAELLAIFTYP